MATWSISAMLLKFHVSVSESEVWMSTQWLILSPVDGSAASRSSDPTTPALSIEGLKPRFFQ